MQNRAVRELIVGPQFSREQHVDFLFKLLGKRGSMSQLSMETHRLSELFCIVSGLDVLKALEVRVNPSIRQEIIEWIYTYQVDVDKITLRDPPDTNSPENYDEIFYNRLDTHEKLVAHSGFRATSMMDSDIPLDCGAITMTYCALSTLVILNDDLSRVDRQSIIAGLKHLQCPDGSFRSSILGGESDMRIVYCAVATCKLLNDWSSIDIDRCAVFIKSALSYEGAFAQCPGGEAHGGSTFCALASLKLMSKIEDTLTESEIERLIRWCVNRLDNGFSGRPNKDQDTCYSFWIGACLVMLDSFQYIDQRRLINFILKAQDEDDGGLSKVPEFISDPLHTYLGLAGLTFFEESLFQDKEVSLRKLDPALNISLRAKNHLEKLHKTWNSDKRSHD